MQMHVRARMQMHVATRMPMHVRARMQMHVAARMWTHGRFHVQIHVRACTQMQEHCPDEVVQPGLCNGPWSKHVFECVAERLNAITV